MSPAPKKRSTVLVAVGAGVFVVGTGLAAFATKGDPAPESAPAAVTTTVPSGAGAVTTPSGAVTFVIPPDKQAIAVEVPYVAGLAGNVKAGDLVNVYGAFASLPINASPPDPMGKLVLQKVKVLSVAPGAAGGSATYMLAVNTVDAEAVVYLTNFQKVWLTLARDDQGTQSPQGFSDDDA